MKSPTSSPGAGPTDHAESLDRFIERTQTRYVRMAGYWLRRYDIDPIRLVAEGAVHAAWAKVLERHQAGRNSSLPPLAEIEKEFPTVLRNVLRDVRRRQNADKRACGALKSLETAGDLVDARVGRPDEAAATDEDLQLLARHDPILREIAIRKMTGHSNATIAGQLRVSLSTIERRLREIRSILKPHGDDGW